MKVIRKIVNVVTALALIFSVLVNNNAAYAKTLTKTLYDDVVSTGQTERYAIQVKFASSLADYVDEISDYKGTVIDWMVTIDEYDSITDHMYVGAQRFDDKKTIKYKMDTSYEAFINTVTVFNLYTTGDTVESFKSKKNLSINGKKWNLTSAYVKHNNINTYCILGAGKLNSYTAGYIIMYGNVREERGGDKDLLKRFKKYAKKIKFGKISKVKQN